MAQKNEILYVNFYTDGSAARKAMPAFPAAQPRKKPSAKRHKKTVIYLDPVAVCSLLVAGVLLIMMAVGLTQLQTAREEALIMENYVHQLEAENQTLNEKFNSEVNLESVEQSAQVLGMVPRSSVQSTPIQVETVQPEEPAETFFGQVYAFLTNLFA